jgi:hypothetical protein
MKPTPKGDGRWAVFIPRKLSASGKREAKYFPSKAQATKFVGEFHSERREHGKSGVTSEQREWIRFAERELGKLSLLPEVIAHWRKTGSGSITPTLVPDAVAAFKKWQLPRVKARTRSDIGWRLDAFSEAFAERFIHQLHAGEIETWLYARGADWSIRSFYKRLRPLFAHGVRHRWLSENPMLLLKTPDVPRLSKAVYTGEQFNQLLFVAEFSDDKYLLPFIALAGFAFLRTSELVRAYNSEDTLTWEDMQWSRNRIWIRESVGKSTRRKTGNERFPGISKYLRNWLHPFIGKATGRIVPVEHSRFAASMRKLHADAEIPIIHNGLRRSAISHYLAAHPETGIGQLARLAGTSEATIKAHYLESLTPDQGREWFRIGRPALNDDSAMA